VVRSRRGPPDRPPRIGPRRAPGPSGPGRCWSWPPRLRPRCGPAGSESRRKPGSAWSPRCRASGPRCIWTLPSPSRRRGLRRVRAARLAGHRAHGQRPDAPVRQAVGDLLVRARDGRAGRLPPDGSGRSGAGAVAHHYRRVLPACLPAAPGPGTALAHMLRVSRRAAGQPIPRTGDASVPCLVLRGPGRTGPGPRRTPGAAITGRARSFLGPERPRSRTTTPRRQHPACPASARRAWPPAGLPRRGSRYSDVPCAARESGAPTNQALNALARMINAELAGAAALPARPGNAVV